MIIPKIYLTEAIDSQSVLKILINKNKQIDTNHPKYNYYKALADWANPRQQEKIKKVDLSAIKLSDRSLIGKKLINRYNTLGSLLDTLKNLMDQEGRYNPESELAQSLQQMTVEILAALSKLEDNSKLPEDPEEDPIEPEEPEEDPKEPENAKGRDWTAYKAEKLANTKNKNPSDVLDEFYNEYYSVEYAEVESPAEDTQGIVAKLKSLDKILIPEFNKLGYNPEVNPFASFLKILIKHKRDIFNKLTTNTYGAIHNSFIAKSITGNMLGQKFDETNILFCSDLYNNNGLDIVEYLSLQKQAIDAAESNNKYSDDNKIIAKIFIQQDIPGNSYDEKIKNLLDATEVMLPGNDNAKIKSINEIRELYNYLFKSVAKKAVNSKTAKEILEQAKAKDIVLSMIRYILDQNEFTSKYTKLAQDTEEWLKTTFNYNRNEEKINQSKAVLSNYIINASAENILP